MNKKILAVVMSVITAGGLIACGNAGTGQSVSKWQPQTAVSIVIPADGGENIELSARIFAEYASKNTGKEFIIVNAEGEAQNAAADQVLASAPDGHTLFYGDIQVNLANAAGVTDYNYTAFSVGPSFCRDAVWQLYVSPDKYESLDALIAAAADNPGSLKAYAERGSYAYYEVMAFQEAAGIEIDLIEAQSEHDRITAVLNGEADLFFAPYASCKDYLESGELICIGIPADQREIMMGEVLTFKEQGISFVYPEYWFSFYFAKDTSQEVIQWYEELVQQILADETAAEALVQTGLSPDYLNAEITAETEGLAYERFKAAAGGGAD